MMLDKIPGSPSVHSQNEGLMR